MPHHSLGTARTQEPFLLQAPGGPSAQCLRRWASRWAAMPLLCAAALVGMPASVIAQVGLTQWKSPTLAQPATLVYPTETVSRSTTFGPFTLEVAVDAPVTPGRHRLVVLSHGTAGSPLPDHALAAQLARAGFVVAQVLHDGDNHLDQRLAGPESFRLRACEDLG